MPRNKNLSLFHQNNYSLTSQMKTTPLLHHHLNAHLLVLLMHHQKHHQQMEPPPLPYHPLHPLMTTSTITCLLHQEFHHHNLSLKTHLLASLFHCHHWHLLMHTSHHLPSIHQPTTRSHGAYLKLMVTLACVASTTKLLCSGLEMRSNTCFPTWKTCCINHQQQTQLLHHHQQTLLLHHHLHVHHPFLPIKHAWCFTNKMIVNHFEWQALERTLMFETWFIIIFLWWL